MGTTFGGSEFQDKGGHLDPVDLIIYKYNLEERSASRLVGAEATFSGLRSE